MSLSVRRLTFEEDYKDICKWWKQWSFECIPPEMLPQIGLIVENNKYKICSVFIYQTDSGICWFNWWLSNKDASKEDRKEGLELLESKASQIAKDLGYKVVFMSINNASLENKLNKAGFKTAEYNKNELIKVL